MVVDVSASADVLFAPTPIAGLAVTIDDAAGYLATAGLQSGDVIIALDGATIDSLSRLTSVLYAARSRSTMTLEVLRGSRRSTIETDPKYLLTDARYGGWIEPLIR
jgi:S1-C subfamily serine protease